MTTLLPRATAALIASNTTAAGSPSGRPDTIGTPMREAQVSSCSIAAARNVSAAASNGVSPDSRSRFASFAAVVVLPLPFTPTTSTTRGRAVEASGAAGAERTAASASRTASSTFGTVFALPSRTMSRTWSITESASETERSERRSASSSSSSH
jgi:hypothetical protein